MRFPPQEPHSAQGAWLLIGGRLAAVLFSANDLQPSNLQLFLFTLICSRFLLHPIVDLHSCLYHFLLCVDYSDCKYIPVWYIDESTEHIACIHRLYEVEG